MGRGRKDNQKVHIDALQLNLGGIWVLVSDNFTKIVFICQHGRP